MAIQIAPILAVSSGQAAIDYYRAAFGATLLWQVENREVVAALEFGGAKFFLAEESPEHRTLGPASAGFTTVRIEVFVDDPVAVQEQALAAGATNHTPVTEDNYEVQGAEPIRRIAQGAVVDPFGHIWLIGKILEHDASSG
jgi:PhnB protein